MNDLVRAADSPVARATSFDDFLRDALSMIPAYAPSWTNHNPSDPGITLIELLAYVSEALIYRAERLSPDAKLNFLRVLQGTDWHGWKFLLGRPAADIDEAIRRHIESLTRQRCAATSDDFEQLAVEIAHDLEGPSLRIMARSFPAHEVPADLRGRIATGAAHGDMIVVLAPKDAMPDDRLEQLRRQVCDRLTPRCLLTSRVHVMGPTWLVITIGCRLVPYPTTSAETALTAANDALRQSYAPLHHFGQTVYLTQIAGIIDGAPGIDYVDEVRVNRIEWVGTSSLTGDTPPEVGIRIGRYAEIGKNTRLGPGGSANSGYARLMRDQTGEAVAIKLRPWELARIEVVNDVR